jgi:hypothetical protein
MTNSIALAKTNKTKLFRIVLISAIAVVATIMFIISVSSSDTNTIAITNKYVEKVEPTPGGLMRPTSDISIDLSDGYIGRLTIDGINIPDDEIIFVKSLGQLTFKPGKAKSFDKFQEGPHVAQIIFWKSDESESINPQSYSWDFRVTV